METVKKLLSNLRAMAGMNAKEAAAIEQLEIELAAHIRAGIESAIVVDRVQDALRTQLAEANADVTNCGPTLRPSATNCGGYQLSVTHT